jgi:hypothetical protein
MNDAKARDGFTLVPDPGDPSGTGQLEVKVFMRDAKIRGCRYKRGQHKLTWHVMQDASLWSYKLQRHPVYGAVVEALNNVPKRVRPWVLWMLCVPCLVCASGTRYHCACAARCAATVEEQHFGCAAVQRQHRHSNVSDTSQSTTISDSGSCGSAHS